ncbi:hypothetical protein [Xanthomonas axonopodis]|uniref:hypothetical protein n=1 Tax=Xanthomonas axonopodis TaxID=53413 RepID=UPI003557E552
MQTVIDHQLADPRWTAAIAGRLALRATNHVFYLPDNRLAPGTVLDLRHTQPLVLEPEATQRW